MENNFAAHSRVHLHYMPDDTLSAQQDHAPAFANWYAYFMAAVDESQVGVDWTYLHSNEFSGEPQHRCVAVTAQYDFNRLMQFVHGVLAYMPARMSQATLKDMYCNLTVFQVNDYDMPTDTPVVRNGYRLVLPNLFVTFAGSRYQLPTGEAVCM